LGDQFSFGSAQKNGPLKLCEKSMEFQNEGCRFYIYNRMQFGDDAKKIHENLQTVFWEGCCSYATVKRWISDFKSGRSSIQNEALS